VESNDVRSADRGGRDKAVACNPFSLKFRNTRAFPAKCAMDVIFILVALILQQTIAA